MQTTEDRQSKDQAKNTSEKYKTEGKPEAKENKAGTQRTEEDQGTGTETQETKKNKE